MILEGANLFYENDNVAIYMVNSQNAGKYSLVLSKNIGNSLEMVVDVHREKLFNEVQFGSKSKDDLVNDFTSLYNSVVSKVSDGLVVIPMLNEVEFTNIVSIKDKQKMFDETKKIGAITSEIYSKLTNAGVSKGIINQKLLFIVENDTDREFVEWLKSQMPNFVDALSLNNGNENEVVEAASPVVNDIFASVQESEVKIESPSVNTQKNVSSPIFDNTAPVSSEPVVANSSVDNVNEMPLENNSFFTSPQQEQYINNLNIPKENVDVFGVKVDSSASANVGVNNNVQEEVKLEEPKPVESSHLEGTMTFEAINSNQVSVQEQNNDTSDSSGNVVESRSKNGFVNLLILLVVLVVITIVSIELGKFLYSVYGA